MIKEKKCTYMGSLYIDMYFFLRGLRWKCFVNCPRRLQLVRPLMVWATLIATLDRYFPETELLRVDLPKIIFVLANNMLLEHMESLRPVNLYRKGTLRLLIADEAEKGYRIAHRVLRWRLVVMCTLVNRYPSTSDP